MTEKNRLTIAIPYTEDEQFETLARQLAAHQLVEEILCLHHNTPPSPPTSLPRNVKAVKADAFFSGAAINSLIESFIQSGLTDYLLLILPGGRVELGARAPERFVQVANDAGAAFVYSDFRQQNGADVAANSHERRRGTGRLDGQRCHPLGLRGGETRVLPGVAAGDHQPDARADDPGHDRLKRRFIHRAFGVERRYGNGADLSEHAVPSTSH